MSEASSNEGSYGLTYILSPVDHLLACLLLYRHGAFVLRSVILGLLLCLLLIVGTSINREFDTVGETVAGRWPLFLFLLLLGLALPVIRAVVSVIACLFTPSPKRQLELQVSAAGIRATASNAETTYKWSAFKRAFVLADRVFMAFPSGGSVPVPKRDWPMSVTGRT